MAVSRERGKDDLGFGRGRFRCSSNLVGSLTGSLRWCCSWHRGLGTRGDGVYGRLFQMSWSGNRELGKLAVLGGMFLVANSRYGCFSQLRTVHCSGRFGSRLSRRYRDGFRRARMLGRSGGSKWMCWQLVTRRKALGLVRIALLSPDGVVQSGPTRARRWWGW